MKPIIEKLPLTEDTSFLVKNFVTPVFEVPWHQHTEYELILFTRGEGSCYIGNYVGDFKCGDIFFLGRNLPHTFQKTDRDAITGALVVQFREDFWGSSFLDLPETREIRKLFDRAAFGIRLPEEVKAALTPVMRQLEIASGFERILQLGRCLQLLAARDDYGMLSTQDIQAAGFRKERIDKIFQFTIGRFQSAIRLADAAGHVSMSVPAFCTYFRRCTKKTYIDFLNEVRVGYACRQLMETQLAVANICYDSGFNTLANFNRQFLKIKSVTPSAYRSNFKDRAAV